MGASRAFLVYGMVAAISMNADAAAPSVNVQRGFASTPFVRNGAGDYSLTLQENQPLATNAIVLSGINAATAGMLGIEVVSTTVLRVRALDSAAMAADRDFWLAILLIGSP